MVSIWSLTKLLIFLPSGDVTSSERFEAKKAEFYEKKIRFNKIGEEVMLLGKTKDDDDNAE